MDITTVFETVISGSNPDECIGKWARGGIGIRVRLRSVSRKGWEFESPRAHQYKAFLTKSLLGQQVIPVIHCVVPNMS